MKQLIFMLVAILALTSCKKEVPNIDPNAKLAINAASSKVIPTAPYSMETVVAYAFETVYTVDNQGSSWQYIPERDLTKLKFWIGEAGRVVYIDKNGEPQLGDLVTRNLRDFLVVAMYRKDFPDRWIHYQDNLITDQMDWHHYDTIGYVPNRVIKAAEAEIHKAFNAGDYEKCTQLFETAYVFQPITGAEWRALKAKNEH